MTVEILFSNVTGVHEVLYHRIFAIMVSFLVVGWCGRGAPPKGGGQVMTLMGR